MWRLNLARAQGRRCSPTSAAGVCSLMAISPLPSKKCLSSFILRGKANRLRPMFRRPPRTLHSILKDCFPLGEVQVGWLSFLLSQFPCSLLASPPHWHPPASPSFNLTPSATPPSSVLPPKHHPPSAYVCGRGDHSTDRRQLQIQCLSSLFLENCCLGPLPRGFLPLETTVPVPAMFTRLPSVYTIVAAFLFLHSGPLPLFSRAPSKGSRFLLSDDYAEQVSSFSLNLPSRLS